MDLGARIGWGVVIYAMVFLAWGGMTTYGWTDGFAPYLALLAVLVLVCIWAGAQLKFRAWSDIFSYSIGWALIAIALDALYMVPSQGWGWFQQWSTWAAYFLIATLPLLSVYFRKKATPSSGPWES